MAPAGLVDPVDLANPASNPRTGLTVDRAQPVGDAPTVSRPAERSWR
ncbi:hypothetical protein [Mycobacterium kiyosense]|nr:hypothetical protein IWGMT90018_34790 [Mycobacterium kiyosense]